MSTLLRRISPRAAGAVVIILGMLLAAWGANLLHGVHDDANEVAWLRTNAPTHNYRVVELGEQTSVGHLGGVWVEVPGKPRAFIDLKGSNERVHTVGDTIRAHVDERNAPALGTGLPADVVSSGIATRYIVPGLITLAGVIVIAGGVRLRRTSRTARRTDQMVPAGR